MSFCVTLATVLVVVQFASTGQRMLTAVMRFQLFYAGVFALIALTAAVGVGLVATDRTIVPPGGRILAQGVHRAMSVAAIAFLVIHIVTEVMAGRSHASDAVVPFLDPHRTLFMGMGAIAADLLVLVAVTGALRGRFAAWQPPWMWRLLHVLAYACWVLAILHGLLAGRVAKPYVDWSYGACVALVAVALVFRLIAGKRTPQAVGSRPAAPEWSSGGARSLPPGLGGTAELGVRARHELPSPADADEAYPAESGWPQPRWTP